LRSPIIAGNWKMHKTSREARELVLALLELIGATKAEVLVCPPFTALAEVTELCRNTVLKVGAQNMFWEVQGAYTGEISPLMLKELGVEYCLIGHSERRQYFGETDATVNKKVHAALQQGLKPVLCVGETLAEREEAVTKEVCGRQLEKGLAGLTPDQISSLVIAYEPVWAIGTGKTASSADAQEVIAFIRGVLKDSYGQEKAHQVRILYGGSVKPENIRELMSQPDIDGALVGGASLKPESFAAIVHYDQR
jgi:triosephosphate isomerase